MNRRSGEDSKQIILKAALKTFSECGYEDASMRMIAKSACMSVGGLYLHFKNKDELCLVMMRGHFEDFLLKLKMAIGSASDPVDAISIYIKTSIEHASRHRELFLAKSKKQGFTFGIEMKKAFFVKQRSYLEDIVRDGIKTGYFNQCNVKETVKIIMSVLRGFLFSMIVDPDNLFSHKECTKLIMKGLLKRNEQ
jgi:AcrR family transcriptional regulator